MADCKEVLKKALFIAVPIVILLAIIGGLLGGSAKDLHATNYGLEINGNTNQLFRNTLYTPGRYFLHLNHYFLEFTKQRRSLVFSSTYNGQIKFKDPNSQVKGSITARTNQGLKLEVGVALHYHIGTKRDKKELANELAQIYENFGSNGWPAFLFSIAEAGIMDAISNYGNEDFYKKRAEIGQAIYDQVSKDFRDYGFTLNNAFLLQIAVNSDLDAAIQTTEITKQVFQKTEFEKATLEVTLQTNQLLAQREKVINIQRAASLGFEAKTLLEADAEVLKTKTGEQLNILQNITTSMGFSSDSSSTQAQKLLSYYWIKMLNQHQAKKLVVAHDLDFITG